MVRLNNPFKFNGMVFGEAPSDFKIPGHDCVTQNACSRKRVVTIKGKNCILWVDEREASKTIAMKVRRVKLLLPQSRTPTVEKMNITVFRTFAPAVPMSNNSEIQMSKTIASAVPQRKK